MTREEILRLIKEDCKELDQKVILVVNSIIWGTIAIAVITLIVGGK